MFGTLLRHPSLHYILQIRGDTVHGCILILASPTLPQICHIEFEHVEQEQCC